MKLKSIPSATKNEVKKMYNNVLAFRLTQKLQEHVEGLSSEKSKLEYELKNLKREYEVNKTKNKGMKEIEKHFFNSESRLPKNASTTVLKAEINRLTSIITNQQEALAKAP